MKTKLASLIFLLSILLAACSGTLEVRLDQTPTPDLRAPATISALQQQNDQLATAVATLDPNSQPLTLDSTPDQIRAKMGRSPLAWQTLYAEGYILEGDSGDPESISLRAQTWIDQASAKGRTLGGSRSAPEWMMLADGQTITRYDLQTGQTENWGNLTPQDVQNFTPPTGTSDTIDFHPMSAVLGGPLSDILFPVGLAQRDGIIDVVEMGETAPGRSALIIDYYHGLGLPRAERMWIDAQTGIILQMDEYGKGGDGQTIQQRFVITTLEFNPQIDPALFVSPPQSLPTQYAQTDNQAGATQPAIAADDSLGEIYFFDSDSSYPTPNVRLVRLPGSCAAGLSECPAPEVIPTPFNFQYSFYPFVWSPDHKLAAFPYPISADGNRAGLFIFNPADLSWKQIAEFNFIDPPQWSADGSWLAFRVQDGMGSEELYAVRPDGSDLQSLTAKLPANENPYIMNGWIGFNLLVNTSKPGSESVYYSLRVPDGKVTPLFEGLITKSIFTPSPDGSLLVYVDYDYNSSKQTLKVLTPNGDTQRELASFNNASIYPLVWSPDGNYIAFVVSDSNANISELYVIRRDGRELQQVYRGGQILNPAFSPDGKYIVFEDQSHIFSVSLATYESRILNASGLLLTNTWLGVSWK
jgi:hypothetical protein